MNELFEQAKRELNEALEVHVAPEERPLLKPVLDLVTGSLAPASTSKGRHGGFEGGLTCHICDVWGVAKGMAQCVVAQLRGADDAVEQTTSLSLGSVFKVALLHDLNKTLSIGDEPYYIPNFLAKGGRSETKPWKINPKAEPAESIRLFLIQNGFEDHPLVTLACGPSTQIRDGQVSLAVAYSLSPGLRGVMSAAEEFAVIYHDGAFVSTRDGVMAQDSALQIVLHAADMIASRFLR